MFHENELWQIACRARSQAYAPYSNFLVGAAVLDDAGRIFAGCNVENAAYPEGLCAEAGALSAMILAGRRKIQAIAIVGDSPNPVTPCGGCRQKIREFALPQTPILIGNLEGLILRTTLAELLPHSFGPNHLQLESIL